MKLPGETQVAGALTYLGETDGEYGQLCAAVEAHQHFVKIAKAKAFLEASGSSAAEREHKALVTDEYRNAVEDLQNVMADRETIRAKRKRAELTIEVWRSVNANRRQGG